MDTFTWCVRVGSSGTITQRTWSNDFGDGYSQAGGIGINTKSESWDISAVGRLKTATTAGDQLQEIRDFLDAQEGYKSFLWTPPGGDQGYYRAPDGYKIDTQGVGIYTLTATFNQVFNP
ncbi:phage tail protein [Pseudomonas sp. B26(2017)]|uniref:phage tail protein n=1 Tax=Pseudomonas sp. B26(2017) TaxID=1981732 RepID=UPI000A1EB681|nr:phage tail protein [Pseudomonas sp. B26(2017)]